MPHLPGGASHRVLCQPFRQQPQPGHLNNGGFDIVNLNFVGSGAYSNTTSGIQFFNDLPGNVKKRRIYIDSVDVSGFGGMGIILGGYNGASGYDNVRITRSGAHHNLKAGVSVYGLFDPANPSYSNTNIYVGHVKAYNNDGDPASTGNTGSGILLGSVNGATIERCVAHDNGINNQPSEGPVGIWAYDANNILIQCNESYHNRTASAGDGDGFDLDQNVSNSVLQYNYSHDNDGAGYLVFATAGRPNRNNVVRYNISQDDSRELVNAGIWIAGDVDGLDVYNNTIFMTATPITTAAIRIVDLTAAPKNVRVRNNLFQTHPGTEGTAYLIESLSDPTYSFQNNNYWSSGGPFVIKWGGDTYTSLGDWRDATGQEKVGTTAVGFSYNPRVTDPGNAPTLDNASLLETGLDAYKLRSDSPLIQRGLNLSSFGINPGARDFYAGASPQFSSYDIGAHESRTIAPPSAPTDLRAVTASTTQINLTWEDTSLTETNFQVEGSTDGTTWSSLGTFGANTTSYASKNLSPATTYHYRVRATNRGGGSAYSAVARATTNAALSGTTVNPLADAHVRGGTYANTNYGNAATLETRTDTDAANARDAYLKFNVNGVNNVAAARLRVWTKLNGAGAVDVSLHPVANTTWTETGITWNNKPARGVLLGSVTVLGTTYAWYEWDVTSYVRSEKQAGRNTVGFVLQGADSNRIVQANSRNATASRPELILAR